LKVGLRILRDKPLIAAGLVLLVALVSFLVYQQADNYGVNMWLFMGLYVSSILPFYYGIGLMITSVHHSREYRWNLRLHLRAPQFRWGYVVNRLAWAYPYLYLMVAGTNLPFLVWAGLVVWVAGGIILFVLGKSPTAKEVQQHARGLPASRSDGAT
jgi:uncharacterized protein with PQ loop repeat